MKPWVLALIALILAAAAAVADTLLLSNPLIRNGYWTYFLLMPALGLAVWAVIRKRSWATIPLGVVTFLVVAGYSGLRFLPAPSAAPAVGEGAIFPDFALKDQEGRDVTLSELRRDGPVVVVLFRGKW
jgi:hypothetical protein